MTVLLVDDQISILSGLMSGLDWDALGITSVRTAGNAIQAREILEKERIDVLLCDIEMPGENGLSLLRWARRQGMDFVCIFLTSHADFMYAKEAIKLNCFDYILQPARYEDIQSTVAKAIQRVKKEHAEKELEQYGTLAKLHTPGLLQNLFSDWAAGKTLYAMCSGGWERRLPPQLTVFPFGDIYCGGIPCPGPPRNGTSPSTISSLRYMRKNITEYYLLRLTLHLWGGLSTHRTDASPIRIPYWSL